MDVLHWMCVLYTELSILAHFNVKRFGRRARISKTENKWLVKEKEKLENVM